jgi:hypothetical protein
MWARPPLASGLGLEVIASREGAIARPRHDADPQIVIAAKSFHTASISWLASRLSAFATSGRLIVTIRIRPRSSTLQ